jgi:DNA-binding NarL/FixJ family response regulator
MARTPTRILVVDDYEPFRRFVTSTLGQQPELQIIGEAPDGLEAVRKATELKPDLILLDIGLPALNGIEAARQIREHSPKSKILFCSENRSWDIVEEALGTGAAGYIVKSDAARDLLAAVRAVLLGEEFVSSNLVGRESTDSTGAQDPDRHEILFYSSDAALLDSLTRFVAIALGSGNPAVVIATKSHLDDIRRSLKTEGLDVEGASQRGTYVELDATQSFSAIMVDGLPDRARFFKILGRVMEEAIRAASAEHPRVAFCGEGLGLLWAAGKTEAAIQLEQLCNNLAKEYKIDMLCAYSLSSSRSKEEEDLLRRVCAQHSAVRSR